MFFVKAAFWITVVILLLPSNGHERLAMYTTVQQTVADIGGFCTRNPDVCEKTSSIASGIVHKLKTTADAIEDMLRDAGIGARGSSEQSSYQPSDYRGTPRGGWVGDDPRTTASLPGDTLRSDDLRPRWQGPGRM